MNSEKLSVIQAKKKLEEGENAPSDLFVAPQVTYVPVEFGCTFGSTYFLHNRSWAFLNHGAYGSALKFALEEKHTLDRKMEEQLVVFYDNYRKQLGSVIEIVADFVGARKADVALVPNASYGMECCINSFIKPCDTVAYLDTLYPVTLAALENCSKKVGATLSVINLLPELLKNSGDDSPFSSEEALTEFIVKQLPTFCGVVVLDHITSSSALILPIFSHLVPRLKQMGVRDVLIDGAHTLLQTDLNFNALPPESLPTSYVANFHKWPSTPKTAALMWKHPDKMIVSSLSSHKKEVATLSDEFSWIGTLDYNAYLTVPSVLRFWKEVGAERLRNYCSSLLIEAAQMLDTAFCGRRHPAMFHAPFMTLIEVPDALQDMSEAELMVALRSYMVEVPVKQICGRQFFRISAFVYNELQDFKRFESAVLEMVKAVTQNAN